MGGLNQVIMKPLLNHFTHGGRKLKQLQRSNTVAIYELIGSQGLSYGYEVIRIKIKKEQLVFGTAQPEREAYPSDSDFGRLAWSFGRNHRKQAFERYDAMVAGRASEPPRSRSYSVPEGFSEGGSSVQLSDTIHFATSLFTPPPKVQGRLTMVIPTLRDIRDGRQSEKVRNQCRECAKLLAAHLYVWRKPFPEKATVKSWNKESLCFQGMDIDLFAGYLMTNFTLRTEDNHEWLLDRSIAASIWEACVATDSPLGEASWQIEMDLKRKAAR
jgi:hypothetical protein